MIDDTILAAVMLPFLLGLGLLVILGQECQSVDIPEKWKEYLVVLSTYYDRVGTLPPQPVMPSALFLSEQSDMTTLVPLLPAVLIWDPITQYPDFF